MDRDQVLELIRRHLGAELEVEPSTIGEQTRFKEDLEADSLDLVELVMELEDRYGVRIPDQEAAKILTVGQAADFVASHASQGGAPRGRGLTGTRALETLRSLIDRLPEELAAEAFTHASWVEDRDRSYERLAFLGDSVLSLSISSDLFPRAERYGAGRLTKIRAQAVARQACAAVAEELGLAQRLRAGAPVETARTADALIASDRVLASVCEAVIGACYLAFGFERVAPAVASAFSEQVTDALEHPVDYKSHLQERLARRAEVVSYRIESEQGPAHRRRFEAVAEVSGEEIGRGAGSTKKHAEQEAALRALNHLGA